MAAYSQGAGSPEPATAGGLGLRRRRWLIVGQVLSALFLLAMGWIHLDYVIFVGAGALLGILFILNAIGSLVLAIAMIATRGRLLCVASVLSVLFTAGTLLALVLALNNSLFGIQETIGGDLVVTALVVESIGLIVLLVTTALAFRATRRVA
jgi:hypothetical protein